MDSFNAKSQLKIGKETYLVYRLDALKKAGIKNLDRLPFSIRILLENLLRHENGYSVKREDIEAASRWSAGKKSETEIAFTPARVILQDFTGVPAVVDLAAMRDAIRAMGGDPQRINPLQPVDLVIDHSVQVDHFGNADAFEKNTAIEFKRNRERYEFLKWGQQAFRNFRVVPPGTGIVHQVNLEYLAQVVLAKEIEGQKVLYPDTLVGTDSHTTMINGLGVLGWGVGGIEAEAAMLGQPLSMLIPEVVGFELSGSLKEGITATDLVLTVVEILRKKGVVGKFVEFFGPGLNALSLADRATLANMAPEYGATMGFFPVDDETIRYLRLTGRDEKQVETVETYLKEQGLFRDASAPEPDYSDTAELDLGIVETSIAGPKRPQDRIVLGNAKETFRKSLAALQKGSQGKGKSVPVRREEETFELKDGAVVLASITSCTNTSNPAVMLAAGLLAKKAVKSGLVTKPWVKASLAPGSKVVTDYLIESGLMPYLEKLKFHLVGYGCLTCIGNSGPLSEGITTAVEENHLIAAAVLSGNRNFEGRIHSHVKTSYLASPPLVVAYALAGTMDCDFEKDPLGKDAKERPVYLRDIWPCRDEITKEMEIVDGGMFRRKYADVFQGGRDWQNLKMPPGETFRWQEKSTYVKNPPYFKDMTKEPAPVEDIMHARVLALLGDSVTTDHISPAGSVAQDSPAGEYLISQGVLPQDFNSYGSRRGNHEVMVRGTFANIRLRNLLVPGSEGGVTSFHPTREKATIYDAAMKYAAYGIPLIIIAGKEYGTGSSRDWAAKGPALLGVKAVLAESFERIHRSNLIGMGILPLQFMGGQNRESLEITGEETYTIRGLSRGLEPWKKITIKAVSKAGEKIFSAVCRIDTPAELSYYRHGGILKYVLRELLQLSEK